MSPTVFREQGYRFYFFSREESRKHVHVHASGGEAKFWLEPEIRSQKAMASRVRNWLKSGKWSRSTMMSSSTHGTPSSEPEVSNISSHGFWLLAYGREYFLAFDDFPWFRDAAVKKILNVEEASRGHFFWPDLDIDLGLDSIEHPERYPLVSR